MKEDKVFRNLRGALQTPSRLVDTEVGQRGVLQSH